MGITLTQWRASIGMCYKFRIKGSQQIGFSVELSFLYTLLDVSFFCLRLLSFPIDISYFLMCLVIIFTCETIAQALNRFLTRACLGNLWWLSLIILLSGDVHENPGPKSFKILHWNVNSISTDNFLRKTLVEAYNVAKNYDIIAISETGLHANISKNDLEI